MPFQLLLADCRGLQRCSACALPAMGKGLSGTFGQWLPQRQTCPVLGRILASVTQACKYYLSRFIHSGWDVPTKPKAAMPLMSAKPGCPCHVFGELSASTHSLTSFARVEGNLLCVPLAVQTPGCSTSSFPASACTVSSHPKELLHSPSSIQATALGTTGAVKAWQWPPCALPELPEPPT